MRRHDRYVLRAFLAALGTALLFLSSLFVLYDLAERIDKIPKAVSFLTRQGRSPAGVLAEYYLTLLPFLWMRILPVASLAGAGAAVIWLARQNELTPLVSAGIPTLRILAPVLATGVVLVGAQTAVRETLMPGISRRHDDLQRLLQDPGREDRFQDVPHVQDAGGGRLSMSAYFPAERRMEDVWLTFRRQPDVAGQDVALRYPVVRWDPTARRWVAERGGQRRVLASAEAGADVTPIPAGESVPLSLEPSLLELTLRQSAAMGFSSAEIAALARANPDKARFTLLLHQQWAAATGTLVLLLLGLPLLFHLGRARVFRSFGAALMVIAVYYLADSIVTDMGARGALNPVVAAWAAHVVFGALGIVMMTAIET